LKMFIDESVKMADTDLWSVVLLLCLHVCSGCCHVFRTAEFADCCALFILEAVSDTAVESSDGIFYVNV